MLIAVGSWPYIRGTLSPSPPGARRSGAPSRIPPRYTSLFSYNDDDGPTVQAATTPLWDRRPTPPSHPPSHIRTCRRNVPLFLRLAPRSLPRARVPAMSRSFFSHVSSPRTLTALRHYCDTFSRERRTYRLVVAASLSVSRPAGKTSIVSACLSRPDR